MKQLSGLPVPSVNRVAMGIGVRSSEHQFPCLCSGNNPALSCGQEAFSGTALTTMLGTQWVENSNRSVVVINIKSLKTPQWVGTDS